MTALLTLITSFFLFVLVYLAISMALSLAAWWMKRQAAKAEKADGIRAIEEKIDRVKDKAFVISLILTFFFVAPFVVIFIFVTP